MLDKLRGLPSRAAARNDVGGPGPLALVMIGSGGALVVLGVRSRSPLGVALALAGAGLAYRGASGSGFVDRLLDKTPAAGTPPRRAKRDELTRTATVNRSREDVYALWQAMPGTPAETLGPPRELLEGNIDLLEESPGELLRWRVSRDGGGHELEVALVDGPPGRGTEVRVTVRGERGGGSVVARVRRRVTPLREQQLAELLRRSKHLAEAGEIPTTTGQPSGRKQEPPTRAEGRTR